MKHQTKINRLHKKVLQAQCKLQSALDDLAMELTREHGVEISCEILDGAEVRACFHDETSGPWDDVANFIDANHVPDPH